MSSMVHYSNVRKCDDPNKVFCNESLIRCYKEYVGSLIGNVLVLDDANFASTNVITKTFLEFKNLEIWLAQHNKKEFNEMDDKANNDPHLDKCIKVLINDDYFKLDEDLPKRSVVIDNADFCCGWSSVKEKLLKRISESNIYADKALLRLTVSARGSNKSMDDFTSDVICDIYRASFDSVYSIKPLTIRQWCCPGTSKTYPLRGLHKQKILNYGFKIEDLDSTSFTYFPSMVTIIFIIHHN